MASGDGGRGQRLLIVEDEQALANAMARTLRSRGFEADIALSGAEARERFGSVDYALVLMDIRLARRERLWLARGAAQEASARRRGHDLGC